MMTIRRCRTCKPAVDELPKHPGLSDPSGGDNFDARNAYDGGFDLEMPFVNTGRKQPSHKKKRPSSKSKQSDSDESPRNDGEDQLALRDIAEFYAQQGGHYVKVIAIDEAA